MQGEDGAGYLPYHDEFTRHLRESPALANARALAAAGWRALGREPEGAAAPGARRQGYRAGVRQLIALGHGAEAATPCSPTR